MHTKLTLMIPDALLENVKRIAAIRGITITEAFCYAARYGAMLSDKNYQGCKILYQEPSGKFMQVADSEFIK